MVKTEHLPKLVAVSTAATLLALALGCSSRDPILGVGGIAVMAPSVTAVAPANGTNPVAYTTTILTAAFSEAMVPFGGAATFTVSTPAPGLSPTGTVTLDATHTVATLTLSAATPLAPLTTYTARIAGATSFVTGLPMAAPYLWSFTTGALDATRPRVTLTFPATTAPGPTLIAPANAAITATFTEDMAPASITAASFTVTAPLPAVAPAGAVTYSAGARTATFTPVAALTVGTVYTARLTTAAKDLAGNALAGNQAPLPAASDYVWSFTASAPTAQGALTVASTTPAPGATGVSPAAAVNATLALPSGLRLDPASVTAATFTLTGPGLTPVPAASVTLDAATGRIATFTPLGALTTGATYTATLLTGVSDLAIPANHLAVAYTWSFTVGALPAGGAAPVALGSIASFGTFGGSAGTTNQGIKTVINGDIGTTAISTLVTGFHDAGVGNVYTETPLNIGLVNGKIYTSPPAPTAASLDEGNAATAAIALQARADALIAYNTLVAKPGGADPGAGNLANLTLAPGTYTAGSGSFLIRGGDLTLDAKGDANAVFIFQMANALTVGGPGAAFPQSLILVNGAQPQNIFWQVGSAATINAGGGGTMAGTIISQAGAALSTPGNTTLLTLNGRVISLGASVTLVNTVINVPAH